MPVHTGLTERLGLALPVIQAPMAGALGFIPAAYLTPAQIAETAQAVRSRTARPFGINLFAPVPPPGRPAATAAALAHLAAAHAELGLPPPTAPAPREDPFAAHCRRPRPRPRVRTPLPRSSTRCWPAAQPSSASLSAYRPPRRWLRPGRAACTSWARSPRLKRRGGWPGRASTP
jgi:hypothetical protein